MSTLESRFQFMESQAAHLESEKRMIQYSAIMYPELVGTAQVEHGHRARGEPTYAELKQQRDELMAALEGLVNPKGFLPDGEEYAAAEAAIANARKTTKIHNPKWQTLGLDLYMWDLWPVEERPFCFHRHEDCRLKWLRDSEMCDLCEKYLVREICDDCGGEYENCPNCADRDFPICWECRGE